MESNITVILTLYKTPIIKIKNLNQYQNYKILIFDQNTDGSNKKKIKKILSHKFKYFYSPKNIGLSKSSNFLLSKVKTKYCLFTQPDININKNSIEALKRAMKKEKNVIFSVPNYSKNNIKLKHNNKHLLPKKVRNINMACMLCDVNKLNKIGFFDEDFFLYWEDIFLMRKINLSNYKMIKVNNSYANHDGSKSSIDNKRTKYIRDVNFMYGELLYDYKVGKLRLVKVCRKVIQNLLLFFFNITVFQLKEVLKCISKMHGVLKFIKFYFMSLKNLL